MARKALTILSIAAFLVTGTQALAEDSCVQKFAERAALGEKYKRQNAGEGMAAAGVTGGATLGTYILAGVAGVAGGPITVAVFVITLAGSAYIIQTRSTANQEIAIEIEPMLLYKQSKAFIEEHKSKVSEMPNELANTVKAVVEWAKTEHKDFPEGLQLAIPATIVKLMETGRLCDHGRFSNAKDLLEILKDMEFAPTT